MVDRIRIAFVDDEPHILAGLRRVMRTNENDWEMAFCPSGAERLELMRSKPFDAVVSDMRMPDMDGAQLLEAVRKLQPATIRVILSGYADTKAVLQTVTPPISISPAARQPGFTGGPGRVDQFAEPRSSLS